MLRSYVMAAHLEGDGLEWARWIYCRYFSQIIVHVQHAGLREVLSGFVVSSLRSRAYNTKHAPTGRFGPTREQVTLKKADEQCKDAL